MAFSAILYSTFRNRCSRCHKDKIFESNNPYSFSKGLKMKEACGNCNLKYEREPGFFYGAMYVSYGLLSGLFIVWFILDALFLQLDTAILLTIVVGSMLLSFPLAFRLARIIWLNFFVRYDKKYSLEVQQNESFKHN